jgi:hypothetical protein
MNNDITCCVRFLKSDEVDVSDLNLGVCLLDVIGEEYKIRIRGSLFLK